MNTTPFIRQVFTAAIATAAIACASSLQAQSSFHISIDTSSLVGNPAGPFSVDFQLNQGDGSVVNTATIGNFGYGSGNASGTPTLFGGATGSLSSGFTLTTTSFLNEAFQTIVPGNIFSFDLTLTGNNEPTTPDAFSFSILDGGLANIPTTGLGDSLVSVDLKSSLQLSDLHVSSGTGAFGSVAATAVPEPTTTGVAVSAVLGLGALVLRRARRN